MMRILSLSLAALGLVILQTSLVEFLTADRLGLEFTAVAVVFAALFMETWTGAWLAFLMGYCMDALVSPFPGPYLLSYGVVYFVLASVSTRVFSTKPLFLVAVSFLALLAEGIILVSVYHIIYDMNVLPTGLKIYLPQACILGGLSPVLYHLFRRLDGHGNGKRQQQAQQP